MAEVALQMAVSVGQAPHNVSSSKISKNSTNSTGGNSSVKTLSIIDTISELATDKTEASRLTLPSPVRTYRPNPGGLQLPVVQTRVPPRHPKVSVPLSSPQNGHFNGAKPRFLSSSPNGSSPGISSSANNSNSSSKIFSKMNLSAILPNTNQSPDRSRPTKIGPTNQQRSGQTPDWIRDIFHHAKRGQLDKLVRYFSFSYQNLCLRPIFLST